MEDEDDLLYGDLNEENLKLSVVNSNGNKNDGNDMEEEEEERKTDNKERSPIVNPSMAQIIPIAMPFLHLSPIDNYTFGSKESIMEIETSYHNRMAQLAESFKAEGMRRTVEAVLLTYQNNHPHVLLLQLGDTSIFKL